MTVKSMGLSNDVGCEGRLGEEEEGAGGGWSRERKEDDESEGRGAALRGKAADGQLEAEPGTSDAGSLLPPGCSIPACRAPTCGAAARASAWHLPLPRAAAPPASPRAVVEVVAAEEMEVSRRDWTRYFFLSVGCSLRRAGTRDGEGGASGQELFVERGAGGGEGDDGSRQDGSIPLSLPERVVRICAKAVEEEEKLCEDIVRGHPVVDSWGTLGTTPNCGIPAAGLYIHRVGVTASGVILVAGAGGVQRSCDSGLSWKRTLIPDSTDHEATCMSVHGDVVYILMEGQLHKSEDAGEAWVLLGRLPPLDLLVSNIMVFCDERHGFVGHEASNIYYTCDGGLTWEARLPTRRPFRFVGGLISACGVVPP